MFKNIISELMNTRFKENSSITLKKAVKNHNELNNVKWNKSIATLSANIKDVQAFYRPHIYDIKKPTDTNLVLTNAMYELRDYQKYINFYDDSKMIFNYLESRKDMEKLLEFDYKKSSIRIYIRFQRDTLKEIIPISSGYTVRLKVANPDLGYFGALFDDIADGEKCISRIYNGKPITLHTAF